PVLLRKQLRELAASEERPGVKPTLGVDRRLMQILFDGLVLLEREQPTADEVLERFGIPGLDQAEATKLVLLTVEVAMMVGEVLHVALSRDVVEMLDSLDDVHGKRQLG